MSHTARLVIGDLAGIQPFHCLPDEPDPSMPTVCYREGGPRQAMHAVDDEVIDLSSFAMAKEILRKHDVEFA